MKVLSNYVSLAIVLMITIVLTYSFASTITNMVNNLRNGIENENTQCMSVRVINTTKYVIINKTCSGKLVEIIGNYTILANTTDLIVLETGVSTELKIVCTEEIYIV